MTFHIETDFSEYLRDANAKNVCISRRPLFVDSDVNSNLDCSSDLHSHPSSDIRRQQSCRLNGHWLLLGGGGCCWPGFEFDLIRLFWLFEFDFVSQTEQFIAASSLSIHEKSLDAIVFAYGNSCSWLNVARRKASFGFFLLRLCNRWERFKVKSQ